MIYIVTATCFLHYHLDKQSTITILPECKMILKSEYIYTFHMASNSYFRWEKLIKFQGKMFVK